MITLEPFGLEIPTHIKFTLYRYDYIDGILISRINRHCRNYTSENEESSFKIKKSDFEKSIKSSPRLKREFIKEPMIGTTKANSIIFLGMLLKNLVNVEWLSIEISYDKEYSRLVKFENKDVVNFSFSIKEGIVDLTSIFTRSELDEFNKKVILLGIMENKYLQRKPFFKMDSQLFVEVLALMEIDGSNNASELLDLIDPKIEEDNTSLIIKTDYTIY